MAEMNDETVQNINMVIKELIVKDFIRDHGKFIKREAIRGGQTRK